MTSATGGSGSPSTTSGGAVAGLGPRAEAAARQREKIIELAMSVEPGSTEERVVDALFDCIARWGLSKTTVEDVARTAGISRATVYRLFPGGKDAILQVALATEVTRLVADLREELESLDDLGACLARAISLAIIRLREHQALCYVREHEWEVVESYLAFDRLDSLIHLAGAAFGPSLLRFLPPERAGHAAMWATRIVVSYLLTPSDEIDPGDEPTARRLVETYLLPGLAPAA
jgi:AcrR family transcriptional regulator